MLTCPVLVNTPYASAGPHRMTRREPPTFPSSAAAGWGCTAALAGARLRMSRAYSRGVTTTMRACGPRRGRGRGFRLWRRRAHGCGVRSHPRRGPRRAARPLGRARAHAHAHAHPRTHTRARARAHACTRLLACLLVFASMSRSLFALLVLLDACCRRCSCPVRFNVPYARVGWARGLARRAAKRTGLPSPLRAVLAKVTSHRNVAGRKR